MIDVSSETLIPLSRVPAWCAERGIVTRYGKPPSPRTVRDWVSRGLLETTSPKIGGVQLTSVEALVAMFAGETAEPSPRGRGVPQRKPIRRLTKRQQQKADEEADAACEAAGW